jgi:hypothetical protein
MINSTAGGSVTTPGEGPFPYGGCEPPLNIVATPDGGCSFVKWTCHRYLPDPFCHIADPYSASTTIDLSYCTQDGLTAHFTCAGPTPTASATLTATATPTPTQTVIVWIDAPPNWSQGGNFTACVDISNVSKFYSGNYDVTYAPDVIEVIDVLNGSIGGTPVIVSSWELVPPATQGTVRIINDMPGTLGVSGNGSLSCILFDVVGVYCNTSNISFTGEHVLYDNTSTEISATWVNDSVHVVGPTPTPSPILTPI